MNKDNIDLQKISLEQKNLIKEFEKTKKNLEETNKFLLNILESSSSISIISTDLKQNILYWNSGAENIFGFKPEEVVGVRKIDIIYADDSTIRQVQKVRKQIIKTEKGMNCELKQVTKNGRILWSRMTLTPRFGEDGKIIGILGIGEDITEHKRADAELRDTMEKLRKTLTGIIHATEMIIETRDPYTAGHQRRVATLAKAIAKKLGLPETQVEGVYMVGVIHDLGKISVPAEILSLPRRLTEAEFSLIKNHPKAGYEILKNIEFPWPIAEIVLQHHERINGSGYPAGLEGKDIILEAKILAVADVVESMASHRPYRASFPLKRALGEIKQNREILYDPDIVDCCLELFNKYNFQFEEREEPSPLLG